MIQDLEKFNWQLIFESTYAGMIAINRDKRIVLYNKKAEHIIGIPQFEAIGSLISDVLPSTRLIEVMESGNAESNQRMIMGNHMVVVNFSPIKIGNDILGAIGIFNEISEYEALFDQLNAVKSLNKELDAIIESVDDGIVVADANCFIVRANGAYQRMTGITAKEFVGKHVRVLLNEGYMNVSVTEMVLSRKTRVNVIDIRNGKDLLFTGIPIFDETGNITHVVTAVRDVSELEKLKEQLAKSEEMKHTYLHELVHLKSLQSFKKIITRNPVMQERIEMAHYVARVDSTVLILGESGVGKELFAQLIHRASKRSKGPFIKINCGAIPPNLLESEFFGYEAGAFTGASKEGKPGLFELAKDGTLFLDEVGELPLDLQVKVLRAIQDKEIFRIGAKRPIKLDVRFVAATNRDLEKMIQEKTFREDLYYRLNVVPINIPPLRERKDDIVLLVTEFLNLFNKKYELQKWIHPEVIGVFLKYDWPGNIRELENTVERLVVTSKSEGIDVENLDGISYNNLKQNQSSTSLNQNLQKPTRLQDYLANEEKRMIMEAYRLAKSTRKAAQVLGISQSSLVKKMKKYGLSN